MGKTCAIVTVPWQSVWTSDYSLFGWLGNPLNYPGEGHHNRWSHCTVGTRNIIARQQSIAFTSPYTNKTLEKAGFVVADAKATAFPRDAAGKRVGLMQGWAASTYFLAKANGLFRPAAMVHFAREDAMWAALSDGAVDAVYTDDATAQSAGEGYRYVHAAGGWSEGTSFGCHPEYGDVVAALNAGLAAFKAMPDYRRLCDTYPHINCDTRGTTFVNVKTPGSPQIADHPDRRADVVISTEAD